MSKFWKNTATLDALVPGLKQVVAPSEAEIAVIGSKPIDISKMPNLKGIFKCGVGTDNVPFEEAKLQNVSICLPSDKTRNIIFEETANFTVYSILQVLYADTGNLKNWTKTERGFLGNQKVLIIGLGSIGAFVKQKLENMVKIITFDVLTNSPDELKGLVEQADVITLHIPLMNETEGWWDSEKLGWMKTGSILVNTSRGSIVNEDNLLNEISNNRIKAVFDVFWQEPYRGPLRKYHPERFFMTPHIASTCDDFLKGLAIDFNDFVNEIATK